MLRSIVAAAVLLLAVSAAVRAEDVWRWTDDAGRIHYSNQAGKVPADAQPVRTQIRIVPASRAHYARPRWALRGGQERARFAREVSVAEVGCYTSAYPYLLGNNPHELADQVKQASLLDALGVPWRRTACR
jgi:hypothetical protein